MFLPLCLLLCMWCMLKLRKCVQFMLPALCLLLTNTCSISTVLCIQQLCVWLYVHESLCVEGDKIHPVYVLALCVFLTKYCMRVFWHHILCVCVANGGLLSGQRWIWGSLGPWSVEAFTLTPRVRTWVCILPGWMWCYVCLCLCTCVLLQILSL